jgi:predicted ABC-type ATPase
MRENGYEFSLFYLWLASAELAVLRVAERVRQGGHDIPNETIKRRYEKGLKNFFSLYQPLADNWYFYDNSDISDLKLIAKGNLLKMEEFFDKETWQGLKERYGK